MGRSRKSRRGAQEGVLNAVALTPGRSQKTAVSFVASFLEVVTLKSDKLGMGFSSISPRAMDMADLSLAKTYSDQYDEYIIDNITVYWIGQHLFWGTETSPTLFVAPYNTTSISNVGQDVLRLPGLKTVTGAQLHNGPIKLIEVPHPKIDVTGAGNQFENVWISTKSPETTLWHGWVLLGHSTSDKPFANIPSLSFIVKVNMRFRGITN